eukprot:jgi/Ulvmu1/4551/UM002_0277.1
MSAAALLEQPEEQQGLLRTLTETASEAGSIPQTGWGSRFAISCRRLGSRATYAIASSVGLVISPVGGVCILGAAAIFFTTLVGFKRSVQVTLTSAGVVALVRWIYAFVTCPSRELSGTEVLAQLSQGDDTMWKSAKELMATFDKLLKAFPDLNRPRIAALRDAAPDELLLRIITIVSRHQIQVNSKDAPEGAMKDWAGINNANCSSDEQPGPVAGEEVLKELRFWIHFAEAAYYEMETEIKLKKWLSSEGCNLLYISSENSQNAPVYFVAVQPERKQLIVALRGTMSINDAVTDMIVTPQQWGDAEHVVHSGIGKSADSVYERLKHLALAFAGSDHSVVLVGHSLGAGAAALLAWRLREQDGISNIKVYAFATPPCSSPTIAQETQGYVTSCVFRDDIVPRLAPKAVVELEKELLDVDWEEMESCAASWGTIGNMILKRAKKAADTNQEEVDRLEEQHRDDPLGHKKRKRGDVEADGQAEGNGASDSDGQSDVLLEPTVPGRVVYLRAMSEKAQRSRAADTRAVEGEGDAVPSDQGEADFVCVEIEAEDPCLRRFRLSNQSVDDHFLEQYRMGLRMRPRIVGGQASDPAEAPQA